MYIWFIKLHSVLIVAKAVGVGGNFIKCNNNATIIPSPLALGRVKMGIFSARLIPPHT